MEKVMENKTPSIIDLDAELAKLTMFRRSPHSTAADRKGSVARLASYRDGRFSPEANTHLAATTFPGETIELDIDDPRGVESKAMSEE